MNYLSTFIESELLQRKIPYEILGAFRFIEREEVRDVLAYLRAVIHQDDLSILRVFKFIKGVGNTTVNTIKESSEDSEQGFYLALNDYFGKNKSKELTKNLRTQQTISIDDFINNLNDLIENSLQRNL